MAPSLLLILAMIARLTRSELQDKFERFEKLQLIDLGTNEAYDQLHLAGALSIPLPHLRERIHAIVPDRGAQLVLYNAPSTEELWQAALALHGLGYYNVFYYSGGLKDWQNASLPLETNVYPYPAQLNPAYPLTTEPDAA
ncbi:MAG: rhodanese-like domain-containing protein [Oligoflexia bacterium]|nr:rhodanese-like domain-containing protein [Oligoflexia bacterium]